MATITVLYFAHLAERAGTREETLELPAEATPATLKALLKQKHERLGDALNTCRVAVDEEFARDDTAIKPGQTVAFIPPVSGG